MQILNIMETKDSLPVYIIIVQYYVIFWHSIYIIHVLCVVVEICYWNDYLKDKTFEHTGLRENHSVVGIAEKGVGLAHTTLYRRGRN